MSTVALKQTTHCPHPGCRGGWQPGPAVIGTCTVGEHLIVVCSESACGAPNRPTNAYCTQCRSRLSFDANLSAANLRLHFGPGGLSPIPGPAKEVLDIERFHQEVLRKPAYRDRIGFSIIGGRLLVWFPSGRIIESDPLRSVPALERHVIGAGYDPDVEAMVFPPFALGTCLVASTNRRVVAFDGAAGESRTLFTCGPKESLLAPPLPIGDERLLALTWREGMNGGPRFVVAGVRSSGAVPVPELAFESGARMPELRPFETAMRRTTRLMPFYEAGWLTFADPSRLHVLHLGPSGICDHARSFEFRDEAGAGEAADPDGALDVVGGTPFVNVRVQGPGDRRRVMALETSRGKWQAPDPLPFTGLSTKLSARQGVNGGPEFAFATRDELGLYLESMSTPRTERIEAGILFPPILIGAGAAFVLRHQISTRLHDDLSYWSGRSGQMRRIWSVNLEQAVAPPVMVGSTLYVAYRKDDRARIEVLSFHERGTTETVP